MLHLDPSASTEQKLAYLLDREEIRSIVSAYGAFIDLRDWPAFRALFTDKVDVDYSDMGVPALVDIPADEWLAHAPAAFARFEATQHLNFARTIEVNGDEAYAVCLLHAQHFLPNPFGGPVLRMIGHYEKWLVRTDTGWRIRKVKSNTRWNEGNWRVMEAGAPPSAAAIEDPR